MLAMVVMVVTGLWYTAGRQRAGGNGGRRYRGQHWRLLGGAVVVWDLGLQREREDKNLLVNFRVE